MTGVEGLGFIASGLVLATFCMKRLIPLRAFAITSNLAFILYGYFAGITPVLALHLVLLPVNAFRLVQALPIACLVVCRTRLMRRADTMSHQDSRWSWAAGNLRAVSLLLGHKKIER